MAKLTEKQMAVLLVAKAKGPIFQTALHKKHSLATLASMVKAGLLEKTKVGVIWLLTDKGREALNSLEAKD